jgi:two-component system chemotaxis response regulator CheB
MSQNSCSNIVVIGSSAGGPRVLKKIFNKLPKLKCSIVVVQHMPKFINDHIQESLDAITDMHVKIPEDKDSLKDGVVYIAPSELQIELIENKAIHLFEGEKINYVCPSVDWVMQSIQKDDKKRFMGIVLTGMGKDGAAGISHMKKLGAVTIAQDQETSAIWGMPNEAIATGHIDWVLNPEAIHKKIIGLLEIM